MNGVGGMGGMRGMGISPAGTRPVSSRSRIGRITGTGHLFNLLFSQFTHWKILSSIAIPQLQSVPDWSMSPASRPDTALEFSSN